MNSDENNVSTSETEPSEAESSNSDYDDEYLTPEIKVELDEYPFEVLSIDKVYNCMIEFIADVNNVIGMSVTATRVLLQHCKWDKQELMERYFDDDKDRKKLFAEVRIVDPQSSKVQNYAQKPIISSATVVRLQKNEICLTKPTSSRADKPCAHRFCIGCGICFADKPKNWMASLSCGHRFCLGCWNSYLTIKIWLEGVGEKLYCPAQNCDNLVAEAIVMRLVVDRRVRLIYLLLITKSFVECNKLMRRCPTPNCYLVIKVQYEAVKPVTCSRCNAVVCFGCGVHWHEPIDCRLLRRWNQQAEKASADANWTSIETAQCPRGHARSLKKNGAGGCNYIRCSQCAYEFCRVCMNAWSIHVNGGYRCNHYSGMRNPRDSMLRRYLFYHSRFMIHQDSLRLESKLYDKVEAKMEQLQRQNMTWIEVQFLRKAVDVLRSGRQNLKYSYAFAFYLKNTNHRLIFEENQRNLEVAVETLSGYLERDIDNETGDQIKYVVMNKTTFCEGRIRALHEYVREGYKKNWWKFTH